jgi:sortase A
MSAYSQLLCVPDTNVMATLEIPSINVNLPIYHGTTESSLQIGIGHLAGSSLPIGGASTHTVLMGHRGLPSAKLLTELDKLKVGDEFCVTALGEEAWYQVDQILIVEPTDTSALAIEEGKDLCTLVTCTPYGVNSHRLLVRGHRVEAPNESLLVTSDAFRIDAVMVASILAIPVLLICIVVVFVRTYNQRYRVNLGDRFNE